MPKESPVKYKVRLMISYDGTDFVGWQKQNSDPNTIQGILENVVSTIFNKPTRVIGTSRTDSGVHALCQMAHFECDRDPRSFQLLRALNNMTPFNISIKKAWLAPNDFHALGSKSHKSYRYYILNSDFSDAFKSRYTWWYPKKLSLDWLNEASKSLVGTHDFKSFQSTGSDAKTTVRQITRAHWTLKDGNLLVFSIEGFGFLKQMVRNIVGTLIDSERYGMPTSEIQNIMGKKDRQAAKTTAPAHGLFLAAINFDKNTEAQFQEISS